MYFVKEKLHQTELSKKELIQDYCNRGERLTSTKNTVRAPGDIRPVGMWTESLGRKLLRGAWPGMKGGGFMLITC